MARTEQQKREFEKRLERSLKKNLRLSGINRIVDSSARPLPGQYGAFLGKTYRDLYNQNVNAGAANRMYRTKEYDLMDSTEPLCSVALNIYAANACLADPNNAGHTLKIFSENERIVEALEQLFYVNLDTDMNLQNWVRSLCKYGDHFMMLDVDDSGKNQGVVGHIDVPPLEMERRELYNVEEKKKAVNFVWNMVTGSSYLTGFRGKEASGQEIKFWNVAHFRLLSDNTQFSPYGRSTLESARTWYRNYKMMYDAMMVYRICLVGDTRIRTAYNGYKHIKDIAKGDIVYSYNADGTTKEALVEQAFCTGVKPVYRVRSRHVEIIGTAEHPILVHNRRTNTDEYVEIGKLDVTGDVHNRPHQFILTPRTESIEKRIERVEDNQKWARLTEEQQQHIRESEYYNPSKHQRLLQCSLSEFGRAKQFVYKKRCSLPYAQALEICEQFELNPDELQILQKAEVHPERINLPEYVDAEFARLLGFLIGDGSITKHRISFAAGTDEAVNEHYSKLLERYFGICVYAPDKRRDGGKYGNYNVNNTAAVRILRGLGMVGHAKTKRIPQWVFSTDPEIRRAFVEGLSDADGGERYTKRGTWFSSIELCNKELVEDVKELWSSIGLSSGHISHRMTKAGRTIKGGHKPLSATNSWTVTLSELPLPKYENIVTVEPAGEELVYDLTIANEEHNFIANGVPVHNCRAPERRVFYVDVGNQPNERLHEYINQVMGEIKRQNVIDPQTGDINQYFNVWNQLEDYVLPMRGGASSKIDTLKGAEHLNDVADVELVKSIMIAALQVPKAYLTFDEVLQSRATLAMEDIRFSKNVERIQKYVISELYKIAVIHLTASGFEDDEIDSFELSLTPVSTSDEMSRLELIKTRYDLINSIANTKALSFNTLKKEILKMSNAEMLQDTMKQREEALFQYQLSQAAKGIPFEASEAVITKQLDTQGKSTPDEQQQQAGMMMGGGMEGSPFETGGFGGGGGGGAMAGNAYGGSQAGPMLPAGGGAGGAMPPMGGGEGMPPEGMAGGTPTVPTPNMGGEAGGIEGGGTLPAGTDSFIASDQEDKHDIEKRVLKSNTEYNMDALLHKSTEVSERFSESAIREKLNRVRTSNAKRKKMEQKNKPSPQR